MRVEESIEINRPLNEVFNYVSDARNYPRWMAHALEVRTDAPRPPRPGDTFMLAIKSVGRRFETPYERTPCDPDRRFTDEALGGPIPDHRWHSAFEEMPNGTHFTRTMEVESSGCSSCWNRFRSGQPSVNSGKTCRRSRMWSRGPRMLNPPVEPRIHDEHQSPSVLCAAMSAAPEPTRFTASLLSGFAEPVRRYLSHAIREGAELGAGVTLTMTGRIKVGLWLPFSARQECDGRSFAWRARVGLGPLTALTVVDRFAHGAGSMDGRLFGRIKLFHAEDENTTCSAAGRAALEAVYTPASLLP